MNLWGCWMQERWSLLEKHVTAPRSQERQLVERGLQSKKPVGFYRYNEEPFRLRRKDFWPLPQARKLLQDFIPNLSHESDGLIFQVQQPYGAQAFIVVLLLSICETTLWRKELLIEQPWWTLHYPYRTCKRMPSAVILYSSNLGKCQRLLQNCEAMQIHMQPKGFISCRALRTDTSGAPLIGF